MSGNRPLHAASRAKLDEFYTQLSDIENELKHYRDHFRGRPSTATATIPGSATSSTTSRSTSRISA